MVKKYRHFWGTGIFLVTLAACSDPTEAVHQKKAPVVQQVGERPDTPAVFKPDAAAVATAFAALTEEPSFKKQTEEDGASLYEPESQLLIGDVDRDGLADVLKPFAIEGRGGGNNWTAHYAVFLNKDGKLVFSNIFNRGGDWAERITTFVAIKNNVLLGYEEPTHNFPESDTLPVQYIYKDKDLVKVSK